MQFRVFNGETGVLPDGEQNLAFGFGEGAVALVGEQQNAAHFAFHGERKRREIDEARAIGQFFRIVFHRRLFGLRGLA